jgi:hypothetical protein
MPWVRNPISRNFDTNISKRFQLNERFSLSLRADALNILNHPNFFFNPNTGHDLYGGDFNRTSLTSPSTPAFTLNANYGKMDPNNTNNGRTFRMAVRLMF